MRLAIAAAMIGGVIALSGCSSAKERQEALDKEALAALDHTTRDPLAMQVRRVVLKDENTICGEVNRKLRRGEYEGFQVFVLDRKSGKAIVAEPYAVQTKDGEKPITICADAEQKRRYAARKGRADAEFKRDLDAFERETKVIELQTNLVSERSH